MPDTTNPYFLSRWDVYQRLDTNTLFRLYQAAGTNEWPTDLGATRWTCAHKAGDPGLPGGR